MGLWDSIFGKTSVPDDQPEDAQRREAEQNPMFGMVTMLEPCDQLRAGYGEFGCPTNPVPVNGPTGEVIYLNRLTAPSGVGFLFHRLGSVKAAVIPYPVDVFELVASDASCWRALAFSMYHPRRSRKAPDGLGLRPWPKESLHQIMLRMPGFGSMKRVADFPAGLPAHVAESPDFAAVSPGLGAVMGRKVSEVLAEHRGRWARPAGYAPPQVSSPAGEPSPGGDELTDAELQDFGVSIVVEQLQKEGTRVLSVNRQEPQIKAQIAGRSALIVVRSARFPEKGRLSRIEASGMALSATESAGTDVYFASVGFANADARNDTERSRLVRGGGMHVAYEGLQRVR